MDIKKKIRELMEERGWTEYRLCKESGLSASTVANMFNRNNLPTISTLESLCKSFGLTLSQFFSEGNEISLTDQQKQLLNQWKHLSAEQQNLLLKLMSTM